MLISFKVRNFKSFMEDATIILTAHRSDKTYASALISRQDGPDGEAHLLPAIAIYGANASGKTNFLMALNYMRDAIVLSQSSWSPHVGTNLTPNLSISNDATEMESVILLDGVRYRYGFQANTDSFLKEWLYSYPVGRERLLFERNISNSDDGHLSTTFFGNNLAGDKRDHNSSLRRTRDNSLLLSALAQDNQEDAKKVFEYFHSATAIFKSKRFNSDSRLTSNFAARYEFFNSMLISLLETADSSIKGIELIGADGVSSQNTDPKELNVDTVFTPVFHVDILGKQTTIPYANQSQGVKRLYQVALQIIMSITSGNLLVFDEIEASMHPHMVAKMIAMFQNPSINKKGSQIIFSTHDTHLLNPQHLRRDQVWFTEKKDGVSELYSLLEYSPRKDENLEIGYMRGRYGAVPNSGMSLSFFGSDDADKEEVESAKRGME